MRVYLNYLVEFAHFIRYDILQSHQAPIWVDVKIEIVNQNVRRLRGRRRRPELQCQVCCFYKKTPKNSLFYTFFPADLGAFPKAISAVNEQLLLDGIVVFTSELIDSFDF